MDKPAPPRPKGPDVGENLLFEVVHRDAASDFAGLLARHENLLLDGHRRRLRLSVEGRIEGPKQLLAKRLARRRNVLQGDPILRPGGGSIEQAHAVSLARFAGRCGLDMGSKYTLWAIASGFQRRENGSTLPNHQEG